jgi:multiple sugar transport system permease protein
LSWLQWLDTYQAQFVPFGASVFGIFLMRQYFLTLPKDLWEAAQLDGCSHLKYLWVIALPLARPALITVGLLQFVDGWNAFLWPLIVTSTDKVRPIQVGLQFFNAADSTEPILLAAAAFMTTVPLLIVFLLAQRQLVGGIAGTGIRG